jgi:hypothetical protein
VADAAEDAEFREVQIADGSGFFPVKMLKFIGAG